jgi:cyclic-di-GMP phosphodiesterase TipF (flagellum assembly factor)
MAFFSRAPSSSRLLTPRRRAAAVGVFLLAAGVFLLSAVARTATMEFTLTVGAMLTLCGVLWYDMMGRRTWEHGLSARMETLSRTTDRLTRESARNRVDIASLRDSLAEAGAAAARERTLGIAAPDRNRDAVQDRTIKTILEHLAVLRSPPGRAPTAPSPVSSSPPEALPLLSATSEPVASSWTPTRAANASAPAPSDGLSDTVVRELVRHTLREGAIDVFLQPVVALPQRRARFEEMFGRIRARSDLYLSASRYLNFVHAEKAGAEMDTLVLLRVFERLRDTKQTGADLALMINVSGATLKDKGFMGDLLLFLTNYHTLARRMVFEMPMADLLAPDSILEKVVEGLCKLGCRFSVDHVETLDLDPQALKLRGVAFAKIDAALLLAEGASRGGIGRIVALRRALEEEGIALIATRIETERDLRELLDYAVPLGQGYLFAPPLPPGTRPARPQGAEPKPADPVRRAMSSSASARRRPSPPGRSRTG